VRPISNGAGWKPRSRVAKASHHFSCLECEVEKLARRWHSSVKSTQRTKDNGESATQICAVVVSYNPPLVLLDNIVRLGRKTSKILIIDNGSGQSSSALLAELQRIQGVHVFPKGKNEGIGNALNFGIRFAIEAGYEWVATFDQDSTIDDDFFVQQFSALATCPFKDRVALISPRHVSPGTALEDLNGPEYDSINVAMTSGSLIRSSVFKRVGFYDESMFIDYVDFDFCLRLQKAGYKIIRAPRAILHHRLGTAEAHFFLGKKISIKTHSAWRRYYIMRNRVLMYRRYALRFPLWCLNDLIWLGLDLTKIVLFESEKGSKLFNVIKGILHGLAGKTGTCVAPS
jgi:rhamnosyltransferase